MHRIISSVNDSMDKYETELRKRDSGVDRRFPWPQHARSLIDCDLLALAGTKMTSSGHIYQLHVCDWWKSGNPANRNCGEALSNLLTVKVFNNLCFIFTSDFSNVNKYRNELTFNENYLSD